jgi:molecular chaperone DnaK (HSP70)
MRVYGVDIGYGYTKVAAAGRAPLVIPSIVGSNEEPSYRSDIGDRIRITPLTLNGHSYLVGEAAKRFTGTVTESLIPPGPRAPIIFFSLFPP